MARIYVAYIRHKTGLCLKWMGAAAALGMALIVARAEVADAESQERRVPNNRDFEIGMREACRRTLGGLYMDRYDQSELTKMTLTRLREVHGNLEKGMRQLQADYDKKKARVEKEDYDLALATARDDALAALTALHEQFAASIAMLANAERAQAAARNAFTELDGRVRRLFRIVKLAKDGGSIGYDFQLDYPTACPHFRSTCPLSPDQARRLAGILEGSAMPDICVKYSQLR